LILVDQDRGTNRAQLGTINEGNQRSLMTAIFAAQKAFFCYKRAKRLTGIAGTAGEQRQRIAELTFG
jgi:hypothetical protein